jgi:hypothetical protein
MVGPSRKEVVSNELALGSLGDSLSSVRVLRVEDDEGVLLPGFDGDGRVGRWIVMVVLSAWMRVKQSSGGGRKGEGEMEASFLC